MFPSNDDAAPDENGIVRVHEGQFHYAEADAEVMQCVIDDLAHMGPEKALAAHLRDNETITPGYVTDPRRTLFLDHVNGKSHEMAADLGCGFGPVTHALAQRYKHVVSTDGTYNRLLFAKRWLERDGLNNVTWLCANLSKLNLEREAFDLIVLNGVLEWVPLGDLDQTPEACQAQLLDAAYEALKPGGTLYIGIENRFALYALAGHPEPHTGIRFQSVVPRSIADLMARMKGGQVVRSGVPQVGMPNSYRTYTYSLNGYQRMLARAGFMETRVRVPLPSYNRPEVLSDEPEEIQQRLADLPPHGLLKWLTPMWPQAALHLAPGYALYAKR